MISCLQYVINALNTLIRSISNWTVYGNIHLFDFISYMVFLSIGVYFITHIQFKGGSTGSVHNKKSSAGFSKGDK